MASVPPYSGPGSVSGPLTSPAGPSLADEFHRAAPPRPAVLGPAALEKEGEREQHRRHQESIERRSVLRGLIFLAVLMLLFGIWHADTGRVFFSGWWRHW